SNPSVQILTVETQTVWVDLRCSLPCDRFLKQLAAFSNGSNLLPSGTVLSISFCFQNYEGNLTGTKITGEKPLGVIAGNCLGKTLVEKCDEPGTLANELSDGDMAAEMLLPMVSFGKEFIIFVVLDEQLVITSAENFIRAPTERTEISITMHSITDTVMIAKRGGTHSYVIRRGDKPRRIVSNYPIQVMYILRSPCVPGLSKVLDLGDVSICSVLPTTLFFRFYFWRSTESEVGMSVIVIRKFKQTIKLHNLENLDLYASSWSEAGGDWEVGTMNLANKFSIFSGDSFGCYVVGFESNAGSIYAPGFAMTYECSKTELFVSDGVDNDCDGEIDEESQNHKDDDHDNLVDEDPVKITISIWSQWKEWLCYNLTHLTRSRSCIDLNTDGEVVCLGLHTESTVTDRCGQSTTFKPVFGVWSAWGAWDCNKHCSGAGLVKRIRACKRDDTAYGQHCAGEKTQSKQCSTCTIDARPCSMYRWGVMCEKDCYNCQQNCSRLEGACESCNAGFKNPQKGCTEVCGFDEYGENCQFSCFAKCRSDCGERVFGTCLASYRMLYFFFVIIIIPALALLLCFWSKRRKAQAKVGKTFSHSSSPDTTTTRETTAATHMTSSNVNTEDLTDSANTSSILGHQTTETS
ncbi:multiple epidermal growth factor-like domains protein 10, partial [Biomphalaria glabrata]